MSNVNEFWHVINGKYIHLVQISKDNKITYYTNGKQEDYPNHTKP